LPSSFSSKQHHIIASGDTRNDVGRHGTLDFNHQLHQDNQQSISTDVKLLRLVLLILHQLHQACLDKDR
jgi:hypothetical protein